ncbi:large conductance mechanosensitive channel protein MscL [Salininema proteolyticum]|uniref:Large-conductance mechanosensitive channel n=1 Tax=Salininema proteolyticum TaxID=1607685 RepID=A0ABV8TWX2_9ACTN
MFKGFKDFLLRGNVVELAVAVVMGAAMTALVSSFGEAFLNPLIQLFTGGEEVGGAFMVNGVEFAYGAFINQIIVFIITAAAIYFVIVLPFNKAKKMLVAEKEAVPAIDEKTEVLKEIRDLLVEQRQATDGHRSEISQRTHVQQ